ncbi:thiamine-phosphate diphosphorylase [Geoalkalibacter ferrihydriticus]|uniref:Thiamine-phosphate synthase n=2 Tax=Geoalkalibacter ferrihydriticus TaxID=392333 RepID=A0A0C2HS45_9BACT|nr:thiamine phosphate synthase [Geoalkalibacter ferrihydriticus]KIH75592.1 thiamine-phosphate synthase [Geoalkalibacter ferrihydriticus DSM 17813]SDL30404.1 thiamine-phosphate diphosphorylase [Geoalkalibacter ferrihydriticus]
MLSRALDFSLYLITDRRALPSGRSLDDAVGAACAGGVGAVQLREKDLDTRALYALACRLREITAAHGVRLLINDRIDLALAVAADGVHLGGRSLPLAVARRLLGPDGLIGVSTHNPQEIHAAHQNGADFVTFGPVYATPSKAAFGPPQGLQALHAACAGASLPVFALGGITPERAGEVRAAGAQGLAAIRAILGAADPTCAARRFARE